MAVNRDELDKTIKSVRGQIRDHSPRLKDDEMVTRMALVDPILRALGWDVADLTRVEVEHNYSRWRGESVDYALWNEPFRSHTRKVKPAGFVEAKKLADSLEYSGRPKSQVDKYRYYTKFVILTDGDHWKIYRTAPVNFTEGPFSEFSITERDGNAVQKLTELQALLLEPDQNAAQEGYGWVPLNIFQPPPEQNDGTKWWQSATERTPGAVKFPGASSKPIGSWGQIVKHTANWLHQEGKLPAGEEIIRPGYRAKLPLVTTNAPQGSGLAQWRRIANSEGYVYTQNSYPIAIRYAKALLCACDVDLESVYLQSQ